MPTRTVNGTTLYYAEGGGTGAPALVLLHGFPLDGRAWQAQVDALSSRYHVIAPDLRGFGQSRSDAPFTIESLADDVRALLADLGALPCVLGGLSMGGYVALAFARKYPADLRGLALIDTRAEADTPDAKRARDVMAETAGTAGSEAIADVMMPKMFHPDVARDRPELVRTLRDIMVGCPAKTIEHAQMAMRDRPDFTADLPALRVPALIVVGVADAITPPAVARAMQAAISNATLVEVPDAGHMTPMEQPAQVSQALGRFMESIG